MCVSVRSLKTGSYCRKMATPHGEMPTHPHLSHALSSRWRAHSSCPSSRWPLLFCAVNVPVMCLRSFLSTEIVSRFPAASIPQFLNLKLHVFSVRCCVRRIPGTFLFVTSFLLFKLFILVVVQKECCSSRIPNFTMPAFGLTAHIRNIYILRL